MSKIEWESTDQDIMRMHMRANSETGEINEEGGEYPLPYRYHILQKPSDKNRWTSTVHRTVFRFYEDIRTTSYISNSGAEITELQTDGVTSRRQLMLDIWNDIAGVDVSDMPPYLRSVPVKNFGPLSKALGIMRGGKPDPYMADLPNGKKRYSDFFGVQPKPFYWMATHVTQYIPNEGGDLDVIAGPKILLLKGWMVKALAEKVEGWRDVRGEDWSVAGFPIHMVNKRLERDMDTELSVRPAGVFGPEDKKVWDMSDQPAIDFAAQAEAQLIALDKWLVEKGAPIKDFPYEGAHADDGWWSEVPMATMQRNEQMSGMTQGKGGFDEFDAPDTQATDKWAGQSDEDLLALAEEYGKKIPARGRTREKIIAALEKAQAEM